MPGPALPASFGRYTLLELVGGGGMASVYRAAFSGEGGFEKELAVKVVRPELATDPQFVEMFLDEARLSARLSHANLVHTFDFGQVDGTWFLAMEYVRGPTLAKLLRMSQARGLPLGVARSIHVAGEVARGLGFAHRLCDEAGAGLGLVHRDVSPQNVLISREGEVKLADFGIAKAASRSAVTRTGHIRGKCAYMAPEQAQGEPLDARTDVFALGVVLWECLTGQPLFDGASDGAVLLQVIQREIPPPSRFGGAVPATLDDLVLRMLARDRMRRPANGDEVARELAELKLRLVRSTQETDLAAYQRELGSGTAVLATVGQGARASGVTSAVVELDSAAILASGSRATFDPLAETRLPAMVAEAGGAAGETRLSRPATGSGERAAALSGSGERAAAVSGSGERAAAVSGSGERAAAESGSGERAAAESGSGERAAAESGIDERTTALSGSDERAAAAPGGGERIADEAGRAGSGGSPAPAIGSRIDAVGAAPLRLVRPTLLRAGGVVGAALLLSAGLWWTMEGEAALGTTAVAPGPGLASPALDPGGGVDAPWFDPLLDLPDRGGMDVDGDAGDLASFATHLEASGSEIDVAELEIDAADRTSDGAGRESIPGDVDLAGDPPFENAAVAAAGSDREAPVDRGTGGAGGGGQQAPLPVQPRPAIARATVEPVKATKRRAPERGSRTAVEQRRQAPAATAASAQPGGGDAAGKPGFLVLTSTWEGIVAASLDGREIAKMGPKSPRQFEVPAGRHEISFQSDRSGMRCRLHAEVKAGEKTSLALQAQGVLEMAHGEFIPRRCLED